MRARLTFWSRFVRQYYKQYTRVGRPLQIPMFLRLKLNRWQTLFEKCRRSQRAMSEKIEK